MMALHMQMLDQHLHCPTFGTYRILNQTKPTISNLNEAIPHLRLSPLSYLSVLRKPLQGEDITTSIQKGSLDLERVVRCIRHALRTTPSPDWWRRVLVQMAEETVKRITRLNPMFRIMPDMSSMDMPSFDGSTSDNSADAAVPVQDDPHHRFYQHT
ncbi:unnamed protein product [Vicia faba]|uniref:Basic leucine-zipper C-terminal domain-containing protein n=1 Tax=Vicia faba TaxID=3906 RepID=A0AAV0ZIP4_VICFA|nr:unnamed protein product [Vicia faba]